MDKSPRPKHFAAASDTAHQLPPLPDNMDDFLHTNTRQINAMITFTFTPSELLAFDIDPDNGRLTITTYMAPVHDLPTIFSADLMAWIGEHLSSTSGGTVLAITSRCLVNAIKHDALLQVLTKHAVLPK